MEPTRPPTCTVCGQPATKWVPRVDYTTLGRFVRERVLDGYCDRCTRIDTPAGVVVVRVVD